MSDDVTLVPVSRLSRSALSVVYVVGTGTCSDSGRRELASFLFGKADPRPPAFNETARLKSMAGLVDAAARLSGRDVADGLMSWMTRGGLAGLAGLAGAGWASE